MKLRTGYYAEENYYCIFCPAKDDDIAMDMLEAEDFRVLLEGEKIPIDTTCCICGYTLTGNTRYNK